MKKFLKWAAIVLGVLLIAVFITVYFLTKNIDNRTAKVYKIEAENVAIPSDSLSLVRGKELSYICADCHNEDLGGKLFFQDDKLGTIYSANLTSGTGGVGKSYSDQDWVRSIRHGVTPAGRALFVMPSADFANLSEQDLGSLIAYLKTLPPVDRQSKATELKTMAKVIAALGGFGDVFAAEVIDHKAPLPANPVRNNSAVYGDYLVKISGCRTCHLTNLGGGKSPDPHSPMVPDITPSGNLGKWEAAQFIQTLRTGKTPEGKELQAEFMPYKQFKAMPDQDLEAIYNYLHSLPAANKKS